MRGFLPSTLAPQKFKFEEKRFLLACGKLVNLQGRTVNIPGSITYDWRLDGSSWKRKTDRLIGLMLLIFRAIHEIKFKKVQCVLKWYLTQLNNSTSMERFGKTSFSWNVVVKFIAILSERNPELEISELSWSISKPTCWNWTIQFQSHTVHQMEHGTKKKWDF